jgi:hypothetical protein
MLISGPEQAADFIWSEVAFARVAQVMMALSNAKTRLQVAGVRRLSNICCMFWMRVTVISSGIRLPKIGRR